VAAVHVVVDTAAALPRGAVQDLALAVLTHSITLGDRRFHGGTDPGDAGEGSFYALLREAPEAPVLTAPSLEEYLEAYRRILGWGVEIVSLHPPAPASDSAAAARAAVAALPAGAPVTVVESRWLGSALGLLATSAAQAGIDDQPRPAVAAGIARLESALRMLVVAADFDYLRRTQRIPDVPRSPGDLATRNRAGDPDAAEDATHAILSLDDGRVRIVARFADIAAALRDLVGRVEREMGGEAPIHMGLFSAGADAEAAAVATFLESRHQPTEMWIAPCDPLTAGLVGAGAFGVAWYAEA